MAVVAHATVTIPAQQPMPATRFDLPPGMVGRWASLAQAVMAGRAREEHWRISTSGRWFMIRRHQRQQHRLPDRGASGRGQLLMSWRRGSEVMNLATSAARPSLAPVLEQNNGFHVVAGGA